MNGLTKVTDKQMLQDLIQEIGTGSFEKKPRTERLLRSFSDYFNRNGSLTPDQSRVLRDIHTEEFRQ